MPAGSLQPWHSGPALAAEEHLHVLRLHLSGVNPKMKSKAIERTREIEAVVLDEPLPDVDI